MRPEPGTLAENGLEAEGGAAERQQIALEVRRSHDAGCNDLLSQPGHDGVGQVRLDRQPIRLGLRFPVHVPLQVGNGRQHVEGVHALGGQVRIGCRRAMQIQAEVLGQAPTEDVVQQTPVAWTEKDRVMGHIRVLPLSSEVPHEQAHRVTGLLQLAVGPAAAGRVRHEVPVRPRGVGVRDDDVGRDHLPIPQSYSGRLAVLHQDLGHVGVDAKLATQSFDQGK